MGAEIRFAFNWEGAWSASTRYAKDDLVSYQGTTWKSVIANTNQTPAEGIYWTVFAGGGALTALGAFGVYSTTALLSAATGMVNDARAIVKDTGEFRYDAASSATAVGSLVLSAAGGVGRWLLELDGDSWRPTYNVRQYGATGGGVADDYAACQAAINACYAGGGGVVFFPPGTYNLSQALTMSATADFNFAVKLQGSLMAPGNGPNAGPLVPPGGSILKATGNNSCVEITNTTYNIRCWAVDSLVFKGGNRGLKLDHAAYGSISNCQFYALTGNAPVAGLDMQVTTSVRISNCQWYSMVGQTCINDYYGSINQLFGCQIGEQVGTCMTLQGTQLMNISGNVFQEWSGYAINADGGGLLSITGNVFEAGGNVNALRLVQEQAGDGGDSVTGNVFTLRGSLGATEALTLYGRKNAAIVGNSFNAATSIMVRTQGSYACEGTIVADNSAMSYGSPANWGQLRVGAGNPQAVIRDNGFNPPRAVTGATATLNPWDRLVLCNRVGTIGLTLPAAPYTGQVVTVVDSGGNAGANTITITPAAGNVNGGANVTITAAYGRRVLTYDGSEWHATTTH